MGAVEQTVVVESAGSTWPFDSAVSLLAQHRRGITQNGLASERGRFDTKAGARLTGWA